MLRCCRAVTLILLSALACHAQAPEPDGAGLEAGTVPGTWQPSGPKCMEVPDWQVHEYNENFYIIRQSGCLDYEKPFLYLLFGKERGLLVDTGSRNFPAALMVESVVGKWLQREHRSAILLEVVHSHPHSDHVWGDGQLQALASPSIRIHLVPATLGATKLFYGIHNWPEDIGRVDLGERVIDAIPIPGHSSLSIALYDRRTGILLTGDSLYPGRLYVDNWQEFIASTHRLVGFTNGKLVSNILGCHVEETKTAFLDYPVGTIYQPEEHALAMTRGDLLALDDALSHMHQPARLALPNFSIWPADTDAQLQLKARNNFADREREQRKRMWDQTAVPKPASAY